MNDTHALSVAIHDKVRSEARVAAGRAALWHSLGLAALIALGGLGIGAGLYGYAALVDTTSVGEAEKVAGVIARALAQTEFKTQATGEVTVVGGTVALAAGQTVGLDPNARLRVDPSSTVRVATAAPRLSAAQLGEDASPVSGHPVTTSFTIFKSMAYLDGSVDTGWDFANSAAAAPSSQYCHYRQQGENGKALMIDLGNDGRYIANLGAVNGVVAQIAGFDPAVAYARCQWYP